MQFEDSMKTLFFCTFLVLIIVVVEVSTTGLCITDDDCTTNNTFCDGGGVCMCTAGHSHLNGDCSPVFGRSCLDDLNCDDGRTFCKDSKCVCNTYKWKEENGICASYYGSFCTDWSDCGLSSNYVCEDNTCKCGAGYKLTSDFCERVINSQCRMDNSTEDCPLDHTVCKLPYWNRNNIYGKCECESGYDENNGICIQVLGSSCADVGCGNTLHYSYKNLDPSFKRPDNNYYYWSSSDHWFDWAYYYHLHLSCNIDNTCVCDQGFKTDASGIFCEPVYGTPCEGADSCGTYHGYTCDSISRQCVCAENYISYNQEWRYVDDAETNDNLYYYDNHESTVVQMCKPELGQPCSIVNCTVENANCDEDDTCSCDEGYTENYDGTCQQVLGMSCIRETFCQIVPGGFCAEDNTCKCKEGYSQTAHLCQLVLDTNCTSNIDCQLEHTACNEGMCECKSSVDLNGERCYGQPCSDLPSLPDVHRRSISYIPVEGEPIIDDSRLREGWYSIGRHSIYWSIESPESGNCATFYPVYLTDPISTSQQDALAAGEDITVTAKVGNMELYGHSEQVNLTLRQCGQDTFVYVTPPSTHFSGICLDNEHILDIRRSTGIKATVLTDLLFSNETDDNVTKHTPYIVFSCVASEFIITSTYERYPYEGYVTDDDIYFYYVHWYIDSVHFRTIGPLRRYSFINGSSIFEMDIIEAGYKLGFGIRCTFEISENPNGQNSLLAISEEIYTGFQPHHIFVNENTDNYFFHLISSSPLGCETTEGDGDDTCALFWPVLVEDDGILCNQPVSENEHHELCRVFVRGYSFENYMNSWGSWSYLSRWGSNYNHHYEENHTVTDDVQWYFSNSTSELLGVYIDIEGTTQTGSMKIKFGPSESTTGHKIWNNYKMPDINLNIARSSNVQEACKISIVNVPILTKETDWTYAFSSENVEIDQVGEFILYRSSKIPVHVQIQMEACSWTTNGVCLCAVNYRDGDNTYIYSYCNGLMRIGQTNGELTNRRIDNVQLINGIALGIETWNNRIVNVSLNTNHSDSTLEDGEGLCMFSPGSYKHRDGTEETDSDGFVSSWRLPINESLLNPLNHNAVPWIEEYAQCGCPDNTEILQEREKTYYYNDTYTYNYTSYLYTNEWYNSGYNVHWGYIRCFAEKICKVNHSGEGEWSGPLLPVFSVTRIEARMEIRYVRQWPLLHLFCNFEGRDGYQYGITWKADDDIVYTSPLLDYSAVENYFITNDHLQTDKFLLEVKFSCGVSIHDASGVELLGSQYSDAISAVEFVMTELLMPRGGDVLIQIRLNIPLVCTKGHPCSFDFKFFNQDNANNCSDSAIAIKGKQTCGQRIIGTSTEEELVNEARIINITVTTTNNAKYTLKDTFYLKVKLAAYGDTSTFWLHTFSQVLTVFVRDDENYWQRNYCYANNDPRMRTFDGQYYNHMLTGLFPLMRHKLLPVEIQLETRQCGGWRVACACGVTIRAGRDVFTINHCHGDHVTGYLLADDRILRVMKRTAHRYQIYLPHGTRVDVRISSWNGFMVNVFIYPSPADMKNVVGLCGNFNGDWGDDLIHSDGKVTSSSRYYWWWYDPDPDDFVQSWGLAFTNDLDLTDVDEIDANLHSWYENDVFCVCTGTDGDGDIRCSANEQDTCITKPDIPGVDLSITVRNKRSAVSPLHENNHRLANMREKRDVVSKTGMLYRRLVKRNTISIEDAIDLCNRTLSACPVITAPSDGVNVTFEELIMNCGQDSVANPETNWIDLTCEAMTANVENEVRTDNKLQKEKPDLATKMTETCVGNCSGHGQCIKGVCHCYQGYAEDDCSIQRSFVKIERVAGDGVCNKKQADCTCILLTTSGSLSDSLYTAIHSEATSDGSWQIIETFQGQVDYRNPYEVMFCPNVNRRRKRSTSGNMYIADQYVVSLSNDGSTFGNSSTVYVLDSTCLQVNHTNGIDNIVLMTGYCIIEGVCYATNSSSPSDSCMICNDSVNPFGWINSYDKDECSESEDKEDETDTDDTDNTKMVLFVAIPLSGLILITVLIAIIVIKKKTSPRIESTLDTGGGLYDMQRKVVFDLRKGEAWN